MSFGVRAFIFIVFAILGASFLATTGVLAWEFWRHDWLHIANFYSHLFVFFPTFGIVTLVAFYMPACVFLDIYMNHVPYGKARFMAGFVVTVVLSILLANMMVGSDERSVFEVRPALLEGDRGEPAGCVAAGNCERLPIMQAIENVRRVSQNRIGLSDLARNCKPDALRAPAPALTRYCFASTPLPKDLSQLTPQHLTGDKECCIAQRKFTDAISQMNASPDGRSRTSVFHAALLPFKVFFMLILLIISVMLAVRHKTMDQYYNRFMPGIERGVLIGAAAMVIFPVMNLAFLVSSALLYYGTGPSGGYRSNAQLLSFGFGAWGLMLLLFFYKRHDEELQSLARMGGIIGSGIAFLKYDQIIDMSVRYLGTGASWINLAVLSVAALGALTALMVETSRELDEPQPQDLGSAPATDDSVV